MDRKRLYRAADWLLVALGVFLIIERLFLHWIYFDYSTVGLSWLDPYFDHWMVGAFLILVAVWDLGRMEIKK